MYIAGAGPAFIWDFKRPSPVQVKLRQGDISWEDFIGSVPYDATVEPHIADAYDVTNILFSSGTTGKNLHQAVLSAGRFKTWNRAARSEAERSLARCSSSCVTEWYQALQEVHLAAYCASLTVAAALLALLTVHAAANVRGAQ